MAPITTRLRRWLRRFSERDWCISVQGGNSAAGVYAAILTGYGFHPRAIPLLVPADFWSRPPRIRGGTHRQTRPVHPFAKPAEPSRCARIALRFDIATWAWFISVGSVGAKLAAFAPSIWRLPRHCAPAARANGDVDADRADRLPARTTVGVTHLARGGIVEVDLIARLS
jgi:hypothetical protein